MSRVKKTRPCIASLHLLDTSRTVAAAERRIVRAVRRWFKHAGATPPVDGRERIAWEQRVRSLHGHVIVAAGLDMEARADHRKVQQAARRHRAKRQAAGLARRSPVNREWQP